MGRRLGASVVNSTTRIVTDYAPDPVGTNLFQSLSAIAQRGVSGHEGTLRVGDKGEPSRTFHGDYGRPLQPLMGAAALALYGSAPAVHDSTGTIGGSVSADSLDNAGLRLFAARARRTVQGFPG